MDEHRRSPRIRTLKSGKIVFNHKSSVVDCTVRNLSRGGACLLVASTTGIPESFELILDGATHPCRIAWRAPTRIGVSFQ